MIPRCSAFVLSALTLGARASASAAEPEPHPLPPFTLAVRAGGVLWGKGGQEMTCDGECGAFAARELAYSHAPAFTLAVDALAAPIGWLRLGPSFRLTAANAVTPEGSSESLQAGHDVTLGVTVEAVPSLGPGWWLTPRLTAGPLLFVPGKELRDALAPGVCAPDAAATCDIAQGTKVGMSGSVGVGALVAARPGLRLRVDAAAEYYSVRVHTLEARLLGNRIQVHQDLSGARLVLLVGAEIL